MDKTYDLLVSKCLPFMRHYQEDLTRIDRELIGKFPGVPFFHWTRDCGTHLAFMHEPDSAHWPAKGVNVPYLFGTADREHILMGETIGTAKYMASHYSDDKMLVHWIDKVGVHKTSLAVAVEVLENYSRRVLRAWKGAGR